VDADVAMDMDADMASKITDAVFTDWGWSVAASRSGEKLLYMLRGDPYSEFSLAIVPGDNRDFTVSVPVPRIGVQYRTTIRDFSEACAFLRTHLDYFMKADAV
jgi:hypothetical protein